MKLLRVFNRQKSRRVDTAFLRRAGKFLLERLRDRKNYELGLHLIDNVEMTKLNETFLRHSGSTDVVTFNHQETAENGTLYGEIFISVDDAIAQAAGFRATWQLEVLRYFVHGILHLEGYDDKAPGKRRLMKREENRLVKELSRRFDSGKLERSKHVAKGK